MIYVNPTPVRTSINYGINNFAVDEKAIANSVDNFVKCNIAKNSTKCQTKFNATMGKEIDNQIANSANTHYIIDNQKNVVIDCNFDKTSNIVQNLTFTILDNVKTQIVLKLYGSLPLYYNGAIKFVVGSNSKVELIVVNNLSTNSTQFLLVDTILKNDCSLNAHIANFGSNINCVQFHSDMVGNNAKLQLNSLYYLASQTNLDLNYIANVYGKNCVCNMDIVGALCDNSTKHLKATINFVKGCTGSAGNENEQCLILAKTAHSVTLPMILCGEENVDGKHATSVGKLDDSQMFYLMSRGLNHLQAENLIVHAHFNSIISKINNTQIVKLLTQKIDKELLTHANQC